MRRVLLVVLRGRPTGVSLSTVTKIDTRAGIKGASLYVTYHAVAVLYMFTC